MRLPLLCAVVAGLTLAACGGGERERAADAPRAPTPEQEVQDDMARWLLASRRRDEAAMCDALTPASRRLMAGKARELGAGTTCPSLLRAKRDLLADPGPGNLEDARAEARMLAVQVNGDRATVDLGGEPVPLRRIGGEWRVDLVGALAAEG